MQKKKEKGKKKQSVCLVNGTCGETKERGTNEGPLDKTKQNKNTVVSLERSFRLESECNGEL